MAESRRRGGRARGAIPCPVSLDMRSGGLGSSLGLSLPCWVTLGKSLSLSETVPSSQNGPLSASMLYDSGSVNMTFNSCPTEPSLLPLEAPFARTSPLDMEDVSVPWTPELEGKTHSSAISGPTELGARRRGQHQGRQKCPSFPGLVLLEVQQESQRFLSKNPHPLALHTGLTNWPSSVPPPPGGPR